MLLGPSDCKTALQLKRLAVGVAAFSAAAQLIFSISGYYWQPQDPRLLYVFDPFHLREAMLVLCLSYLVYKGRVWAAVGIFILQVLTMLNVWLDLARLPTVLSTLKLLVYLGGIRAVHYLNKKPAQKAVKAKIRFT